MTSLGWLGFIAARVLIVSFVVSAIVVIAGWQRRKQIQGRAGSLASSGYARFELGRTPFAGGMLDLTLVTRAVLARMAPLAASHFVQLEMAVQPGLTVRADERALNEALGDLVANAVRHATCGRVLVDAVRHHGRVQVSVTHDGADVPEAAQEAALRGAERLIALQGGTLQVEGHPPAAGSTVILRLPEPLPPVRAADPPAATPELRHDSAAARDIAAVVWGR